MPTVKAQRASQEPQPIAWGADGATPLPVSAANPLPVSSTAGGAAVSSTNPEPVYSPGGFFTVSANFTRPADTTAYAQYDRVADSTSAATVLEFTNVARATGEAVRVERIRLRKTGTSLTNAQFRVHLFRTLPTVSANDNAAFSTGGSVLAVADIAGYVGTIDITMDKSGTVGARGVGVPTAGTGITCEAAGTSGHETSLWCVIEALAAYTPISGEVFTVTLEAAKS